MLEHYPAPTFVPPLGLPPVGPAPAAAHTQASVELHIRASIPRKLPAVSPVTLSVSQSDLAAMMWEDAGEGGLAPATCLSLCADLVVQKNQQLWANAQAHHMPTHYRRVGSEVLGTASALAVAQNLSPCYTPLRADFNAVASSMYDWRPVWRGSGPDYLVCDLANSSFYFLEAKGQWGLEFGKPRKFAEFKTQSLNAQLIHIPSQSTVPISRHVLSYCGIVPGELLTVRWFNQRGDGLGEASHRALPLLCGFAQFLHDLRAAGLGLLADTLFSRIDLLPQQALAELGFDLIEPGGIWLQNLGEVRIAIEKSALHVFQRIADWRRNVEGPYSTLGPDKDSSDRSNELESIRTQLMESLFATPEPVENGKLMFRLPTGVSFWTVDDPWQPHYGVVSGPEPTISRPNDAFDQFTQRVIDEWLPTFCDDPSRQFDPAGFVPASVTVTNHDAEYFLRAIDSGLVFDVGGGRYRAPKSHANEQLFWEGARATVPRPLTLWIEPVITIATIARLHFDLGWPVDCLGMQSNGYAFDLVAYDGDIPVIAGEVKRTKRDIDTLMSRLIDFSRLPFNRTLSRRDTAFNAFQKWRALIDERIPFFWAIGPGDYNRAFRMEYRSDGNVLLHPISVSELARPW